MKKILYVLIIAQLVMSCQDVLNLDRDANLGNEISSENQYVISVDDALAYLESFMADEEDFTTRSLTPRIVSSITPIKYSALTRASQDNLSCENLLYIANFEHEQGYAILAGDTRIEEKVIAIADDGQLSEDAVYSAMEFANEERIILEDYPTTGAGFFSSPETGSELFINPNTVSLYDEIENDTFVGNFRFDDIGAEYENGGLVESEQTDTSLVSTPEYVTSSWCVSYAVNEIKKYERCEDLMAGQDVIFDDEGNNSATLRIETTKSEWTLKDCVNPILSKYSSWDQGSPFNDLYPKRRKYIIFGKRRRAPAGCFPLAISKILTHFQYPNSYTFNGYKVNWGELDQSYESTVGKQSASYLLMGISSACDSWYFYEGTFTFPGKVLSYMRFIGLNNAGSHNYSFDRVTEMVDNGCPLIIYSVPGINVFKSHSWNIDGYKIKERMITTKTYLGSTLQNTAVQTETCKMVHCDFGWGGKCNGFYVSGVFKLNDSNVEHDPNTSYSGNTNYNNLLKVITYDRP